MSTIGRLFRVAAVLALTMGLVPLTAFAQSRALTVTNGEAPAGGEVALDVILSDTTDIAGANLTVKLENTDVVEFFKYDGSHIAEKASATTSWTIDENLVSPTEFRTVFYSSAIPPVGLGASADTAIVKIHFKVKSTAAIASTARVFLDTGLDTSVTPPVGLTRLSDADGVSYTPTAEDGTITVLPPFSPITIDFAGGAPAGWSVVQVFPDFDLTDPPVQADSPGVGIGLKVVEISGTRLTFGYYGSPAGTLPPAGSGDLIVKTDWLISSSETDAALAPDFRARLNASDFTVAQMIEVQSPANILAGRLSPTTTPKVISHVVDMPISVRNNEGSGPDPLNNKGYILSFDLVATLLDTSGPPDSKLLLHSVSMAAGFIPTAGITPVAAFNYDWTSAGTDALGWTSVAPAEVTSDLANYYPNRVETEANNGLVIRATGTQLSQGQYAYAAWLAPAVAITGDSSVLYRLKLTIASQTADVARTPHFRTLILSQDYQWDRQYEVVSKNGDASMAPSASGTDYDVYFVYPTEMNGAGVLILFEMINDQAADDPNGSFKLLKASLEQMPMPPLFD